MAYNFMGNDRSNEFGTQEIKDNNVMCILAYIPILFWLPLVSNSSSAYCKFHANQGLCLLITAIALSIVSAVIGLIFGWIPILGGIISGIIGLAISAFSLGLMIYGMVMTGQNKSKELPVIGSFIELIK